MLPGGNFNFFMVALRDDCVSGELMPSIYTSYGSYNTWLLPPTYVKIMGRKLQYNIGRELLLLLPIWYRIMKLLMVHFRDKLISGELMPPIWTSNVSYNTQLLPPLYFKIMGLKLHYYTGRELLLLLLIVYRRRNHI